MALDYRACISRGLWTEDALSGDQEACLWITAGLWSGPFGEYVLALLVLGLGRHGFCLTMD